MKMLRRVVPALVGLILAVASGAWAQAPAKPFIIEVRGGFYVPTFDIADVADPGPGFGATFGYMVSPRLMVFGEGDFGLHGGADDAVALAGQFDVDTYHYMGKVGYVLYENPEGRLKILVNAGLGAMTIKVKPDQGEDESNTYFAINAGAKLYYLFAENIGFVLSPQGDIAFSKEEDVGASSSWVWPFTAGFFVSF